MRMWVLSDISGQAQGPAHKTDGDGAWKRILKLESQLTTQTTHLLHIPLPVILGYPRQSLPHPFQAHIRGAKRWAKAEVPHMCLKSKELLGCHCNSGAPLPGLQWCHTES